MNGKSKDTSGIYILEIHGKLIMGLGDINLRNAVKRLLKEGHQKIVISLKHVKLLDSAGIGELVACMRSAMEKGAEIKLAEPSHKVRDILTRFPQNFEIFDSVDAATASF